MSRLLRITSQSPDGDFFDPELAPESEHRAPGQVTVP